jgi:hypothetical protein
MHAGTQVVASRYYGWYSIQKMVSGVGYTDITGKPQFVIAA